MMDEAQIERLRERLLAGECEANPEMEAWAWGEVMRLRSLLSEYGVHKTTCFAYRSHATGVTKGGYTDLKDGRSYSEECTCGLDDAMTVPPSPVERFEKGTGK